MFHMEINLEKVIGLKYSLKIGIKQNQNKTSLVISFDI